ncbi:hypothetical protein [Aneurinibacillus aneurinilyticus]
MIEPIGKSKLVYLVGVSKIGRGEANNHLFIAFTGLIEIKSRKRD